MEGGDSGEGDVATYTIDWPDEGPAEAAKCPECHGSGVVVLLLTKRLCAACGGTGATAQTMTCLLIDPSTFPKEPLDGGNGFLGAQAIPPWRPSR